MNYTATSFFQKQIVLSDDEVNVLGPDLVLDQCHVVSDCSSKEIVLAGVTMVGGIFEQTRTLEDFHFERAHLKGVAFVGSYAGCDFGDWDDSSISSIQGCIFIDARLDGCRFLNCDVSTMTFPKWPGFAILAPSQAATFVGSRQWPAGVKTTLVAFTDSDSACVAVCGDAERLARKGDLKLSDLRSLLADIPGMQIVD